MQKKYLLLENFLVKFLQNEIYKTGFKKAVLGLSGGIDSAVVALLAKKSFGKNLLCLMMPSQFSSKESIYDAKELCEKFDLHYEIISIEPMLKTFITKDMDNLRIGNLSARVRMTILYDISARENGLVIGTSNKSELLLGYGTLFGDLASAINPIGDLYKSEIFEFAKFLGVTKNILDKPPSADLWEGQKDEEDLGYSYENIDIVLKELIDNRRNLSELIEEGFDKNLCNLVIKKIYQNQFKRKLPIIAKVSERSIGHDFLYPRDVKL